MEAPIQHSWCTTGWSGSMLYNRYTEICPAFHSSLTKYLAFLPQKIIMVENCTKEICTIHLL